MLLMLRQKFCVDVKDFGPINFISDLLQLSLKHLVCSHDWSSATKLARVDWVAGVMDFVEM